MIENHYYFHFMFHEFIIGKSGIVNRLWLLNRNVESNQPILAPPQHSTLKGDEVGMYWAHLHVQH